MIKLLDKSKIDYVLNRVSRLYDVQLPIEFTSFEHNESANELYVRFKNNGLIERSFRPKNHITIEFDDSSQIIAVKIGNISDYLPKED